MIGLELSSGENVRKGIAFELALLCERRGVHVTFTYHEPVIRFIPPLVISKPEIDQAIAVLDEALGIIGREGQDLGALIPQNVRSGPFVARMLSGRLSPMEVIKKMWRTSPQQWVGKFKSLN